MTDQLHLIEDESYVSGDLASLFYNVTQRSAFLRVEPVISYGGRPLERLSVGQKGTVYLCLKLATQAFTQPLIFDQPEDDLDNEFIIEELVEIFRGIKQYRQVILVTHNANLVVNADAEQVVVAENNNGVLRYTSGSLESEVTNKAVRRILEGGDDAWGDDVILGGDFRLPDGARELLDEPGLVDRLGEVKEVFDAGNGHWGSSCSAVRSEEHAESTGKASS